MRWCLQMTSLTLLATMLSSLLLMTVVRFEAEWVLYSYWKIGPKLTPRHSPSRSLDAWKPCTCQTGFCNFQPNMTYDLFQLGPFSFHPSYRNPCWRTNGTLACLPFFYLAGFPKCGTTDLYTRIRMHQHVRTPIKEPHWITRERYKGKDFAYYTTLFANSVEGTNTSAANEMPEKYNPYISGDCSASTMWDNNLWFSLPGNSNCSEPRIIHADYIRHLVPDAKIIVILREPISRLYSDYTFFTSKPSQASFHRLVVKHLKLLRDCLKHYTVRHCVYNSTLQSVLRVQLGLYHVFLEDWLLRFPPPQILVMRMEDMRENVTREMLNVFSFLGLEKPSRETLQQIQETPRQNEGVKSRALGSMWNQTWKLLEDFYRPFNERLAIIMKNERYLWRD